MKLREIAVPVTSVSGVGNATAKLLSHLSIFSVGDLLSYWPRTWEDRTKPVPIAQFATAKVNTIAKVVSHDWFGYGAMRTLKVCIEDGTGMAELVCFNRPFLEKSLPVGSLIRVYGSFSLKFNTLQSTAFEAERVAEQGEHDMSRIPLFTGNGVQSVYPLTAGVTNAMMRKIIARAMSEYGKGIEDELPESVIASRGLLTKAACVKGMHRPASIEEAQKARYSLIFEELYLFQSAIGERSLKRRGKLPDESILLTNKSIGDLARSNGGAGDASTARTASSILDASVARTEPSALDASTARAERTSLEASSAWAEPSALDASTARTNVDLQDASGVWTNVDLQDASSARTESSALNASSAWAEPSTLEASTARTEPSALDASTARAERTSLEASSAWAEPSALDASTARTNVDLQDASSAWAESSTLNASGARAASNSADVSAPPAPDEEAFLRTLSPKQTALYTRLPFALTADQKNVIAEMNADIDASFAALTTAVKETPQSQNAPSASQSASAAHMASNLTDASAIAPYSMARLLQGDVGSGKTLAAFFACLRITDYGGQSAILAPTELLAKQHAENAAAMLEVLGVRLAFLTGNIKSAGRNRLLSALKAGDIDIVIGTHALFSQNVHYKDLRLVIVDEQHRFGVLQRNAIMEKGRKSVDGAKDAYALPNLLMMSATPIPQTLALSVFGDLDVSTIRTMPKGRLPIKTHLTKEGSEENVYNFIKNELAKGRQAYFVYPLIEQGDTNEGGKGTTLKSAEEMFKFLQSTVFPNAKCALIHSKVAEEEQHRIMSEFKNGAIQLLVATSVVEVGVDVANATCMVIEHAERFGLAALHQLRGRVGRSNLQSHCFLVYSKKLTEEGKARLKALFESTDGFYIAEQDLVLRGPGEVLGVQQSGYLTLSIADPVRDKEIMKLARDDAFNRLRFELNKSAARTSAL